MLLPSSLRAFCPIWMNNHRARLPFSRRNGHRGDRPPLPADGTYHHGTSRCGDLPRCTALGMSFKTRPSNFGEHSIQLKNRPENEYPRSHQRLAPGNIASRSVDDHRLRATDCRPFGRLDEYRATRRSEDIWNDYETLQKIAAQVEKVMEAVPGIVDIDNGLIPPQPHWSSPRIRNAFRNSAFR